MTRGLEHWVQDLCVCPFTADKTAAPVGSGVIGLFPQDCVGLFYHVWCGSLEHLPLVEVTLVAMLLVHSGLWRAFASIVNSLALHVPLLPLQFTLVVMIWPPVL